MKKQKPDLILLDLLMPQKSGFDFLHEVRAEETARDIPIFVVSALTDEVNINKSMELGAAGFIKKPVDIEQMVKSVASTLAAE
jgi:DNA-binding response OmpR family regulator